MSKFEAGEGEEWRAFYEQHKGGGGNVIMCIVSKDGELAPSQFAVFSCIQRAEDWAHSLGDECSVCFAPFVVDEPDFGNARQQ